VSKYKNIALLPKEVQDEIEQDKIEKFCKFYLLKVSYYKREKWLKKQKENEQKWRDLMEKVRNENRRF